LIPAWKQSIDEGIDSFISRGTWELIYAPKDAVVVGCRWVYTLKYRPDGFSG